MKKLQQNLWNHKVLFLILGLFLLVNFVWAAAQNFQKIAKEFGSPIKKEMGGEVMDTTKSMPVGMMDGGKVKKMNMGGVIPGRGGMFKGMK
jgi:hypothetical protein